MFKGWHSTREYARLVYPTFDPFGFFGTNLDQWPVRYRFWRTDMYWL
jgi:hypothetical protein